MNLKRIPEEEKIEIIQKGFHPLFKEILSEYMSR